MRASEPVHAHIRKRPILKSTLWPLLILQPSSPLLHAACISLRRSHFHPRHALPLACRDRKKTYVVLACVAIVSDLSHKPLSLMEIASTAQADPPVDVFNLAKVYVEVKKLLGMCSVRTEVL